MIDDFLSYGQMNNELKNVPEAIIFLAGIEWGFLKQGQQYLAETYARLGHRVIYVEPMLHRQPRISDIPAIVNRLFAGLRNRSGREDVSLNNLTVISPIALPETNSLFRYLNKRLFLPRVSRACNDMTRNQKTFCYFWWMTPGLVDLYRLLNTDKLIYSCVDNHSAMPGCPSWLPELEVWLGQEADMIMVTSRPLMDRWMEYKSKLYLRNRAVDYDLFAKSNSGPVTKMKKLLFYGGISSRIDLRFLDVIGEAGYEVDLYGEWRTEQCIESKKVAYRGKVKPNELPDIIKGYDGIVWPYCLNEYTASILPAKLYECMASGKPIFSTPLPALADYSDNGVYLCGTPEAMLDAISSFDPLLDEKYYPLRIIAAKSNSWETLAESELNIIRNSASL